MAKRRVVLTGASGYVAQRMFPELSERWDLVPIDVRPTTRDGKSVPGIIVADLTIRIATPTVSTSRAPTRSFTAVS